MELVDALIGSKVKWTGDRIATLASIQPRHIGRVASFDYYESELDPQNYQYETVMGTLDGYVGQFVQVSGDLYDWARVGDLKIWRSELHG